MFKLPKSFTDPTLQSLSLEELFNPVKNNFFIRDQKYLSGPEFEAFYKAVFTRDNIASNLDIFFPLEVIGGYLGHDELKVMLGKITDEDLWLLAFLCIHTPTSGNRLTWIKNAPRMLDYGSSRLDAGWDRASWTQNYAYTGNNFTSEITTVLRELETKFRALMAAYPNYLINLDPPVHGNAFISKLGLYTANRKSYTSSEYTPQLLLEAMRLDPNMAVRIQSRTYHGIKLTIINPVSKVNKAALFNSLPYSADVLELLPWPLVTKGERSPILYGVELEVSTKYTTQQLIEATDEPFMACKVDSSITGSMRYKTEMVTCPMSLRAHKREWSHFFSNLDYDNFDTTIDTNNGMHVHIGKDNFTDTHLRTFAWFFGNPCNRDFIVALSERKANQMHQYAAMPDWNHNTTKTGSLRTVIRKFEDLRGAVNIHKSKPTIEVRIFKGIASYATVQKNLEAVDAIVHFTQQCSQTSAGLKEFLKFVTKTPRNKYSVLKEFLATLDTKKMLSAAELHNLLFNVSDPRKIVSLIQTKHFPVTSHHVSLLNAKQGVRTFIFNKELGTIEIVRTKHGKMSHLDRVLEQKYTRQTIRPTPPIVTTSEPIESVGLTAGIFARARDSLQAAQDSNPLRPIWNIPMPAAPAGWAAQPFWSEDVYTTSEPVPPAPSSF